MNQIPVTDSVPTPPPLRWAQIVSDVFSPLLVPTYAMAMSMWITPLRVLPEKGRLLATGFVALITAVVPFLAIMVLMRLGQVADRAITRRDQRSAPYSVAVVCYAAASWTVHSFGAPMWLSMFFAGAAVATAFALVVNTIWKISAHATAVGGLAGMMAWFAAGGLADVGAMLWLSGVLAVGGLVCTARLVLGRHTLAQVCAGFIAGAAICFGMMWIH